MKAEINPMAAFKIVPQKLLYSFEKTTKTI